MTELQIKEIVTNILEHDEAEMGWWLNYLKVNTGLDNLIDYIFYPDFVGLNQQDTLEQIADKIIADRKWIFVLPGSPANFLRKIEEVKMIVG